MNEIDFTQKFAFDFIYKAPEGYEEFNTDWFLSISGDMICRRGGYNIEHDILGNITWPTHLSDKRWFDANTFLPAYTEACRRAGVNQVVFNIK